jgi:PadR family transcriptional regulator PadR
MKRNPDFDVSTLEEMVLRVLLGGELYGLAIIKAIEEATEGKRRVGFGSLYPTLHQLEKKRMVTGNWGTETPQERSRARRRYYKITGIGEAALREADSIRGSLMHWNRAWGRA